MSSCLQIDVRCFNVPIAHILVAQLWSFNWAFSLLKFSVKNVLGYLPIIHVDSIPKPPHAPLFKDGEHSEDTSSLQDNDVWHFVMPGVAKDMTETCHGKAVLPSFLVGWQGL